MDIFFLEESSFNENTSSYFCRVCHARMGNMKRPTSTTKVTLPEWEPYSSEKCSVCELQTPPSAKVGRKPKQKEKRKVFSRFSASLDERGYQQYFESNWKHPVNPL